MKNPSYLHIQIKFLFLISILSFCLETEVYSIPLNKDLIKPILFKLYQSSTLLKEPNRIMYVLGTLPIEADIDSFPIQIRDLIDGSSYFLTNVLLEEDLLSCLHQISDRCFYSEKSKNIKENSYVTSEVFKNTFIPKFLEKISKILNWKLSQYAETQNLIIRSYVNQTIFVDSFMIGLSQNSYKEGRRNHFEESEIEQYKEGNVDFFERYIQEQGLIRGDLIQQTSQGVINLFQEITAQVFYREDFKYQIFTMVPITELLGKNGVISQLKTNEFSVERVF